MRRALSFTVCLLTMALGCVAPLHAESNYNISLAGQVAGSWDFGFNVTLDGNIAYVATHQSGMRVMDISDPTQPVEIGHLVTPGRVEAVTLAHGVAFLACSQAGTFIVNIDDPTDPSIITHVANHQTETGIVVQGDYAYVEDGFVLQVLDVSNPANAQEVWWEHTGMSIHGLDVEGNVLTFGTFEDGFRVYDISDPTHPVEVGSLLLPGYLRATEIVGDVVYVAGQLGLYAVDISDPTDPQLLSTLLLPFRCDHLVVDGEHAYLSTGGLRIVDISDPSNLITEGAIDPDGSSRGLAVDGDTVYFMAGDEGLWILDVADPFAPVVVGSYNPPDQNYQIAQAYPYVLVTAGEDGTLVFDVSDPALPVVVATVPGGLAHMELRVEGDRAFISVLNQGVRIVDIADPTAPVELGTVLNMTFDNVDVQGDILYGAATVEGLVLYDISDPADPFYLGTAPAERAQDVEVAGDIAYVADYFFGLRVIDVAEPAHPLEVGAHPWDDANCLALDAANDILYLADRHDGVHVLDVTVPAIPNELTFIPLDGRVEQLRVADGRLVIAHWTNGVRVFNVENPSQPWQIGYYDTEYRTGSVDVHDGRVYVADESAMLVLDAAPALTETLLEVSLTVDDPLIVPAGNSFTFTLDLISNLPGPYPIDFWTEAVLPNGNTVSPITLLPNQPIGPNTQITVTDIEQAVPAFAPPGFYTYSLKAGVHPQAVVGQDAFTFEVTVPVGGASGGEWTVHGLENAFTTASSPGPGHETQPATFAVAPAWPNPFNAAATVSVTLPATGPLTALVYDIQGRLVATLADGTGFDAGTHRLAVDGSTWASGVYFLRVSAPGQGKVVRKLLLVR